MSVSPLLLLALLPACGLGPEDWDKWHEDDTGCDAPSTWYRDADGDGAGDPSVAESACDRPTGYAIARPVAATKGFDASA